MTTSQIIQTIFEGVLVILSIIGFLFEEKIANWEEEHIPVVRRFFENIDNKIKSVFSR